MEEKMFDKKKSKIVIVHYGNVTLCPPVLNLVECLINNEYRVYLIAGDVEHIPEFVKENQFFDCYDLGSFKTSASLINKIKVRRKLWKNMRDVFVENMKSGDIVWTTNDMAVLYLNKLLIPYKDSHVLQLMELIDYCPVFYRFPILKFPIDKYARNAWKTVVPEENRAYIQTIQWSLKRMPYVLPNKPYYLEPGIETDEVKAALKVLNDEKRKIILYLGVFSPDRDMKSFIQAVDELGDEYCLVAIGRKAEVMKEEADYLIKQYDNFKYLGFFNPPQHLHFLKRAHIGLAPYKPSNVIKNASPLNALYCAPNKIYEYAGYGVPIIGTDVMGLKYPFEKYDIGVCCKELSPASIVDAVKTIESNYETMSDNCLKFYKSLDIDSIVETIIMEG